MNILFLIRELNAGGAQRQLLNLASGLNEKGHTVSVATFYSGGELSADCDRLGITLYELGKIHRWDVIPFLSRLFKLVKRLRPQIIQGFDGVPNCLALLVAQFNRDIKVVWGVRASFLDLSQYDYMARFSYKMECFFSRFADLIIANSDAGKDYTIENGFHTKKMVVVYNGVDTSRFSPDVVARQRVRAEWGVATDEFLVGLVGRLDPMKDHPNFLAAISKVTVDLPEVKSVCVGGGVGAYAENLIRDLRPENESCPTVWVGVRTDIPDCLNALDLLVSSSYGEGFPNVIAEAMACGKICVVTDVGDCATIVGSCGIVTPPRDSGAIASAIVSVKNKPSDEIDRLASEGRARIVDQFSISALVDNTESLLVDLCD
jgi:glycosyltransferase involved in cell wall biosynthesis